MIDINSQTLMTPEEQFQQRVAELMDQGCSFEEATQIALEESRQLADQADEILDVKLDTEWQMRFGDYDEA